MSSFNQTKRRKSGTQLILRVVGIFVGVLSMWFGIRILIAKSISHTVPVSVPTIINTLLPKRVLVQKINELQSSLERDEAERVAYRVLVDENDNLKAELSRSPRPTGTLAHVLTLPNRSFYGTFIIDAGEVQGISVGQTVYAFDAIALGKVSAVVQSSATVTLFSASGQTTSGTAVGSDVAVTLIGRGGGEYEVRLPRDVHFEVGGLIAYQSTVPAVLAQIERIATDPRDPFQKLYAKAPVNLQALKWVIVR